MVKDLIDVHTFQWDREKIHDLFVFAHRTRMEILSIPLQSNPTRDVLVWNENKSHSFSVKSAYQVAIRLQELNQVEHSTAGKDRTHWRKIWKLSVPPKVCNFIWRACSNILPTRESLHRRRVNVDARCELCCACQQPESAGHLLWECPFARNVWALCPGKIQKCPNEANDFFLLFKTLVQRLSTAELEKWAVVSWGIWNARNKVYIERVQPHPKAILVGAVGFLQEYQNLTNAQRNNG